MFPLTLRAERLLILGLDILIVPSSTEKKCSFRVLKGKISANVMNASNINDSY